MEVLPRLGGLDQFRRLLSDLGTTVRVKTDRVESESLL